MYRSLRKWLDVSFTIYPFIKRNGAGTKEFGDPVAAYCYPESKAELITNVHGAEVTSTTRLYVDGNLNIKVTDNVVFEGETRPIQLIHTFYRNGRPDVKVVYL